VPICPRLFAGSFLAVLRSSKFVAGFTLVALAGCSNNGGYTTPEVLPGPQFEATIQRTSYGIPHVSAGTLAGASYGLAVAYAQDNLCLLADQILTNAGERSRHLGPDATVRPGTTLTNVRSDLVNRFLLDEAAQKQLYSSVSIEAKQLISGYVAGYNRVVRETTGKLPAPCTGAAWVRPMTELDMYRLISAQAIQSGYGAFLAGIYDAAPPAVAAGGAAPSSANNPRPANAEISAALAFINAYNSRPEMGSNAYALGRDATDDGTGLLLGNPHFPWSTTSRFYQFHLTVPGSVDVMGASLGGFPMVNIGFNRNVAWSHTVSTGRRFTLFEMTMQGGTSYITDGVARPLTRRTVTVDVRNADGSLSTRSRDFYASHHGPVLVGNGLTWGATRAYSIKDANADNARMLDQWLLLARATSVADVQAALRLVNGLPWVNTIAADRVGNAFYADISVTPNVSNSLIATCSTSPTAQAFLANRTIMLDGSKAACEWPLDPASGRPLLATADMPQLTRADYAANSNDSAWLANPAALNTSFSPIVGFGAREQSLRTRLAFTQIAERLAGTDGKPGRRFNMANLEQVFFDNRNYSAELVADALVALCRTTPSATSSAGRVVNLAPACTVLGNWNKRFNLDAVGVPVFREFWRIARTTPSLWSVPFSATDPVGTPRGVNSSNPAVAAALLKALADSVEKLTANGTALDVPLRSVQYALAGTVLGASTRIPIDGGDEFEGPFNKMTPAAGLTVAGYTPIVSGSSYIQIVGFDAAGPVARGVLTYSQSTDPSSPHYADQTALYATGKFAPLPFSAAQIAADPNLKTLRVSE
jgi:acyl-homoserine-lactone acylase